MKLLLIIGLIVLVICGPFMTIWALNTLFSLHIQTNFWTWLAALLLGTFFGGHRK